MLDSLSEKLSGVFSKLGSHGTITEKDLDEAMREVRIALLEADVNFKVVRQFIASVRERALGAEVLQSLTRHLHEFVRETSPTIAEWDSAIEFLTEVGRWCSDTRQGCVLLSDVLGVSMLGVCESLALAEKLGLDPTRFFDIASKSSGQCWSLTTYCPWPGPVESAPSNRNYEGGFLTALMLKDLRLAMEAAESVDAWTPMGAEAEALYTKFAEALGGGGKDFSAIIKMLDESWVAPESKG